MITTNDTNITITTTNDTTILMIHIENYCCCFLYVVLVWDLLFAIWLYCFFVCSCLRPGERLLLGGDKRNGRCSWESGS